jgi:hypothetical protein
VAATFLGLFFLDIALHIPVYSAPCLTADCSSTTLQSLFTDLTGQQSPISIVVSTLAIAAVFSPLRAWIQTTIDVRFYRRKYDAEKSLAHFSYKARQQVNLDELSHELLHVIQETMQPQQMSLWLRKSK